MNNDLNYALRFMIGSEELLNRVSRIAGTQTSNYPPFNLIKDDNSTVTIELGLAGFNSSEISVYTENNVLYVSGNKKETKEKNYLHKALANRSFNWSRAFSEDMKVDNVDFRDGLLTIKLVMVVPEDKKKRVWL